MDIYVQNCCQCKKRTPVASMIPVLGKRYCEGCGAELAKLVATQHRELRTGTLHCQPAKAEKQPRGMVRWWNSKAGEWQWVSKRSRPALQPIPEQGADSNNG